MYNSHTESWVTYSILEKCKLVVNSKKGISPCACVWLFGNGENHLCQWGSTYTALVEQVLRRESSNSMQLIHTKTSLNLSLTTIGFRLSASIVGGRKRPPCEAKWRPVMRSIHAPKVTPAYSDLCHCIWTGSVEDVWYFFPSHKSHDQMAHSMRWRDSREIIYTVLYLLLFLNK